MLDQYFKDLITFYNAQPDANTDTSIAAAKRDFDAYILSELIKSAGINQKNNKSKIFQRFMCHQYMIYALIALSLLIVPFGIDFGINKGKDRAQHVIIDSVMPAGLNSKLNDTTQR